MSNAQKTKIYTEDLGVNEEESRGEGREARDVLVAEIYYKAKRGYVLNAFVVTEAEKMYMRSFAVYRANPLDITSPLLVEAARFNAKTLAKLAAEIGTWRAPLLKSLVDQVRTNYHAKKAADAEKAAARAAGKTG